MKRIETRLFLGAIAALFVLGLFIQSCSSNATSPVSSNDGISGSVMAVNNNSGLVVPDFAVSGLNDNSNLDLVLVSGDPGKDTSGNGGRDSSGKGGVGNGGGGNGNGGPGKGGIRLRPLPIPCLDLDSAQMLQVRQLMSDASSASKAAGDAYRTAMQPIRDADSAAMADYRLATKGVQQQLQDMQKKFRQQAQDVLAQVKAGTMTRDDAKLALQALRTQFETDTKGLRDQMNAARDTLKLALSANNSARKAANDAYQAALKQIQSDLNTKIAALLTPGQLLKWQLWLAGGDPCKGSGPRK